ncbi:hypothetical protein [Vogesella fluminis]|uniref:Lipoprotein n=1 Tax=Vogesella fluminis TaxID=1069161 RepID=A0ABQ3HDH5_9NEIS|nr:hypothetical protein [Vogesella fluminis]GHD78098.1 hypothetical protein GCM10011419_19670 [Vogesella fluminis]
MVAFVLGALSGCAVLPPLPGAAGSISRPVAVPPSQRLYEEAQTLSARVAKGELSRVAVADRLGELRVQLVGRNVVDDDVFALYRQIAVRRDAGQIDSAKAQQLMQQRLQMWLQRWPHLAGKPAQPAFTDFMLKLYGMPALGR